MLTEVPEESPLCPYVLWEEEIQYWDRGWFISSGTTRSYLESITMFSLEKRYVRNWGGKQRGQSLMGTRRCLWVGAVWDHPPHPAGRRGLLPRCSPP